MKKIYAFFLAVFFLATGFAQQSTANDIVVLLDTSNSMLPYFDTITDDILPGLAANFVRNGDTFHLISFNVSQNLEVAQIIKTKEDVEHLISRFLLLYPLGKNSDFISALKYTTQYTSALRVNSKKTVILISDGLHSPGASTDADNFSFTEARTEVNNITSKMKSSGWDVYFIKTPAPEGINIVDLNGNFLTQVSSGNTVNSYDTQKAGTGSGNDGAQYNPGKENAVNNTTNKPADTVQPGEKEQDSKDTFDSASGENKAEKPDTSDGTDKSVDTGENPLFNPETDSVDISGTISENLDIAPVELPEGEDVENFAQELLVIPEVVFPTNLGKKNYKFNIPLKISNPTERHIDLELSGIIFQGKNILKKSCFLRLNGKETGNIKPEVKLPSSLPLGEQSITIQLEFADNIRSVPSEGTFSINLQTAPFITFIERAWPVILTILLILISAAIIIALALFIHRKMESSNVQTVINKSTDEEQDNRSNILASYKQEEKRYPDSISEKTSGNSVLDSYEKQKKNTSTLENYNSGESLNERISALGLGAAGIAGGKEKEEEKILVRRNFNMKAASSTEPIPVVKNRSAMLQLDVLNQTKAIGKKNIHIIKAGTRLGIGGGKDSPFEIFLVKFPKRIAEVRFNGENCDLAILKPEFFPYEESNIIKDCIGREFHIVSSKNYPVTFKLIEYEDPVKKLNALLTSIKS